MKRVLVVMALTLGCATAWALDFNDVKNLLKNQVPEAVVINMAQQDASLAITPAQANELRTMGASENLVASIRKTNDPYVSSSPYAATSPYPAPPSYSTGGGQPFYADGQGSYGGSGDYYDDYGDDYDGDPGFGLAGGAGTGSEVLYQQPQQPQQPQQSVSSQGQYYSQPQSAGTYTATAPATTATMGTAGTAGTTVTYSAPRPTTTYSAPATTTGTTYYAAPGTYVQPAPVVVGQPTVVYQTPTVVGPTYYYSQPYYSSGVYIGGGRRWPSGPRYGRPGPWRGSRHYSRR